MLRTRISSERHESVRAVSSAPPLPPFSPPAGEGERIVPFRLDRSNDMMGSGGLPHDATGMELELSVRFDADGKVETKEGDVTVAVPVEPDATGIEVVLDA